VPSRKGIVKPRVRIQRIPEMYRIYSDPFWIPNSAPRGPFKDQAVGQEGTQARATRRRSREVSGRRAKGERKVSER